MSITQHLGAPQRAHGPMCRRCKVRMKPGTALENTMEAARDGEFGVWEGSTIRATGPAQRVACWKCPKCGKSLR